MDHVLFNCQLMHFSTKVHNSLCGMYAVISVNCVLHEMQQHKLCAFVRSLMCICWTKIEVNSQLQEMRNVY